MTKDEDGLGMTGAEMVALAGSVAMCISNKMTPREICLMRTFFQAVASNLATIEYTDTLCKTKKFKR